MSEDSVLESSQISGFSGVIDSWFDFNVLINDKTKGASHYMKPYLDFFLTIVQSM